MQNIHIINYQHGKCILVKKGGTVDEVHDYSNPEEYSYLNETGISIEEKKKLFTEDFGEQ